jgi:hypothetical protein
VKCLRYGKPGHLAKDWRVSWTKENYPAGSSEQPKSKRDFKDPEASLALGHSLDSWSCNNLYPPFSPQLHFSSQPLVVSDMVA